MKVVTLQQGTPDWHAWRRTGIGGSDAPVVLGVSPYNTPRGLYREKVGLATVEDIPSGLEFIFQKGRAVEGLIRRQFHELTGVRMEPLCGQHEKHPHILASLDGFDPKLGPLEAKLVGQEVLALAGKSGSIPEHHRVQIQHQLAVTGHDHALWYGHDGIATGVLVDVERDEKLIQTLLERENEFWDRVVRRDAPPLSDQDYLEPEDDALLRELRDAKELADNADIAYQALRKKVVETYKHPKIAGAGLKVFQVTRTGNVDWKAIPEVANLPVDYLNTFRGKPSTSWTVTIDKVKK